MPVKRSIITIIILLLLLILFLAGCQDRQVPEGPRLQPEESLERVVGFYQQERRLLDSWWEQVALFGAGISIDEGPWRLPSWSEADLPPGSPATSYAGFILGLLARGEDPWEWQGRCLPAELASLQQRDGSFGGTVNNTTWAVVALEVVGFSHAREKAMAFLEEAQQEDGGFSLSGSSGDPDVTAMALLALSFYRNIPGAETTARKALAFLEEAMLPSGGFASYNEENANSAAMVLAGLISRGEDIREEPWQGQERGLLKALLAYQLEDGSFSFFREPLKRDYMATYQSLLALGDVVSGTSAFHRLQERAKEYRQTGVTLLPAEPPKALPKPGTVQKGAEVVLTSPYAYARIYYTVDGSNPLDAGLEYEGPIALESDTKLQAAVLVPGMAASPVASFEYVLETEERGESKAPSGDAGSRPPSGGSDPKPPAEPVITVRVQVVGESKTHFDGKVKVPADKANALEALLVTGLNVKLLYKNEYVYAIEGEEAQGVAGWKYKVNASIPTSPALNYGISENDIVIWWYAETPDSTGP